MIWIAASDATSSTTTVVTCQCEDVQPPDDVDAAYKPEPQYEIYPPPWKGHRIKNDPVASQYRAKRIFSRAMRRREWRGAKKT